jgi:hypothetical protein
MGDLLEDELVGEGVGVELLAGASVVNPTRSSPLSGSALWTKPTQILTAQRVRDRERLIAEAEALVGTPVHVREESHLFGWPRITGETQALGAPRTTPRSC